MLMAKARAPIKAVADRREDKAAAASEHRHAHDRSTRLRRRAATRVDRAPLPTAFSAAKWRLALPLSTCCFRCRAAAYKRARARARVERRSAPICTRQLIVFEDASSQYKLQFSDFIHLLLQRQ